MNTGRYDQKIQFITEGSASDGYGGYIPVENIDLETFAAIEQMPRAKTLEQFNPDLPMVYRVRIHHRSSFTPTVGSLVDWNGNRYRIITSPVLDDVRKRKEITFEMSLK